ncbi:MAG: DUF4831 family protein [Prevotella sp.]|jgi:hypothetical protein|nr:DUF4831 family protein [Prevotella sp.]MCI2079751.1 DUF4831 family protein [Prevotella sp.]MCI2101511.1 DUF4831 family protein [Prevotella sp.]
MKKLILTSLFLFGGVGFLKAQQPVEGTTYFLPKTAMRFSFLVEKTVYTPGEFAQYAERYMKETDVNFEPSTTYRIIHTSMAPLGVPDSSKQYTLSLNKKYTISNVSLDDNGVLLAVNAKGRKANIPAPYVPGRKPAVLNPKDFMNEDILTAGSSAKMAELCAQEIYDIRDSRAQLSKGKADTMPKDGEQLKLMLNNLDTQEKALLQVFNGMTVKDTTEVVMTFIPQKETSKKLFFRFSRRLGFTDIDDLGGAPYYIITEDEHTMANTDPSLKNEKKEKDDINLNVNVPDKIKVSLYEQERLMASFEFYAAQFGKTENLSGELFGKKQTTQIVLNPITGGIEHLQSEAIK